MNANIKDAAHASFIYYDSDYPSTEFPVYQENLDTVIASQGIADDVPAYKKLCTESGRNVLELCCGTGRVSIPLVLEGNRVTAVDISSPLLKRFKDKISAIEYFPHDKLTILKQDVTKLSLGESTFDIIILGFNSLLCITDFELQQRVLSLASHHLAENGIMAIDIWNPLAINLRGDEIPEHYFSRRRTDNGNHYTRFAATGPMDVNQVQSLYGWYYETDKNSVVKRTSYSMEWRLIFRYELELMLEKAGLKIKTISGGNNGESLLTTSSKMFVVATKIV